MSNNKHYHPFWLTFQNQTEELQYSEREFKYESRMIGHFLLQSFFVCIALIVAQIIFFTGTGISGLPMQIAISGGLALILFIGFAIIKWPCIKQCVLYSKLNFTIIFSIIILVFEIFSSFYFSSPDNEIKSYTYYESYGLCVTFMIVQLCLDLIIFFSWKWILSVLLHIANFIFLIIIPLKWNCKDNTDCKAIAFAAIVRLALITFFLIFLDFMHIKMKICNFHDIFQRESQLDQFKIFLKELVPMPIIIGSFINKIPPDAQPAPAKQNIKFFNDSAKSIFGNDKNEIEDIIWNLLVDYSGITRKITKNNINDSPSYFINLRFIDETPVLENIRNQINAFELNNFYSVSCKYEKNIGNNRIKKQQFEIKIAKIIWEGSEELALCLHDIGIYKEFDEFKNNLLANVSHNLRTPIHTINTNLELAYEQESAKPVRKLIKQAKCGCLLLTNAVNDLLDYSQLCIGSIKIQKKWIPLAEIIFEINKIIKQQARCKGLLQEFISKIDLSQLVHCDPDRLKQILLNILNNAIKFTMKGFINFQIDSIKEPRDNSLQQISFTVKDSGVGIGKENMKLLFNLYKNFNIPSNEEGKETFNIQGVGLGLNISNELLKIIENTKENLIIVQSKIGEGSCFSFKISTKLNFENNHISNLKENVHTIKKNRNQIYALAVDDDPFCLDVVVKLLTFQGIVLIKTAQNGQESLDIIVEEGKKDRQFDIIIMDCNMPMMDGFEATRKINQMIEKVQINQVAIVALTANIGTADEKACEDAGMSFHLKKPVKKDDFFGTLNKILNIV